MKQDAGFVEDNQVMLEEIFSNGDSSFFQPKVDWSLPPVYDEYTEDGFLILPDEHIKNNSVVAVNEIESSIFGDEIADLFKVNEDNQNGNG